MDGSEAISWLNKQFYECLILMPRDVENMNQEWIL